MSLSNHEKISVESGKGVQGNVAIFVIFDFLNWVAQRFIILLFILLFIFKVLHNLKVYTCEKFEESFN